MVAIKQQLQHQARDLDHADKANLRQAVDMALRVGEFSIEQRHKLDRLLDSPYFGRIDCRIVDVLTVQAVYNQRQFLIVISIVGVRPAMSPRLSSQGG